MRRVGATAASRGVRAAVAAGVLLALAGACTSGEDGDDEATSSPTATPTAVVASPEPTATGTATPTAPPTATATPTATPTAPAAFEPARSVLVASALGVARVEPDGTRVVLAGPLLEAVPADELDAVTEGYGEPEFALGRITDDLAGGLVFEVGPAIYQLSAGAPTAEQLVIASEFEDEGRQARLRLLAVEDIEGARSVVFTVWHQLEGIMQAREVIWMLDLDTRAMAPGADIGAWESGPHSISYGGGVFVVAGTAERSNWTMFLAADGSELDVAAALRAATEGCFTGEAERCTVGATIEPSGDRVALLQMLADDRVELAVVEVSSGDELYRIAIDGELAFAQVWFDGTYVLLGVREGGALVDLSGDEPIVTSLETADEPVGLPGGRAAGS